MSQGIEATTVWISKSPFQFQVRKAPGAGENDIQFFSENDILLGVTFLGILE